MPAPINTLKAALAAGDLQQGLWVGFGSDAVAEQCAAAGYDWCLIDGEHGPNDIPRFESQLRAMAAHDTSVVVRVPQGDDWLIKMVVDLGAQTVVVPMVNTAQQAERVARAMRYPPHGHRGMGASLGRASMYSHDPEYLSNANEEMCCIIQAETMEALENLEDICAVEGVDGVFIGPADLSADMGHTGNSSHPDVIAAIERAVVTIRAAGKAAGMLEFRPPQAKVWASKGVTFLAVGSDVTLLKGALTQLKSALE